MMKGYLYVLKLRNGKYYIGSTNDLERRISEHKSGQTTFTRNNRLFELFYSKEYAEYEEAVHMEKYLKKQKSRKVVEELMSAG